MPPKGSKAKKGKETSAYPQATLPASAVVELEPNTDTTSGLVVPVFAFEVAKTAAAGLSLSV